MLAIERFGHSLRGLPGAVRLGLAVVGFGAFADLVTHLGVPGAAASGAAHTPDQVSAHLIVFAGMVLIVLGVVVDGARQSRARRPAGRDPKGVA